MQECLNIVWFSEIARGNQFPVLAADGSLLAAFSCYWLSFGLTEGTSFPDVDTDKPADVGDDIIDVDAGPPCAVSFISVGGDWLGYSNTGQ